MKLSIRISAEIKPTEDEEKLARAISKIFPVMELKIEETSDRRFFTAQSNELRALAYIKENFGKRRVRAAVARILKRSSTKKYVSARLSKQAAYVGQASLLDEDEDPAIGYIYLEIETDDPEGLIKWLTKY